jgi:hypothetical protein
MAGASMSTIVGVRQPSRSRVAFVRLDGRFGPVHPGQQVVVEDDSGQFSASVVIGSGQLHPAQPEVPAGGQVVSIADAPRFDGSVRSLEDVAYRARKARFPSLGASIAMTAASGVVIAVDMRDEIVTVRGADGATVSVPWPQECLGGSRRA